MRAVIWLSLGLLAGCEAPPCADPATCDQDEDGVVQETDCDDLDPDVGGPVSWYGDCDEDGVAGELAVVACEAPILRPCDGLGTWRGQDEPRGDCDDLDPALAAEGEWYADCDGDGATGEPTSILCGPPADWCQVIQPVGGWFDHPTEAEADCDDEDDTVTDDAPWYPDCDGDGVASEDSTLSCGAPNLAVCGGAAPAGGWTADPPASADCDDEDPGADEVQTWYADCDGDGVPAGTGAASCGPSASACGGLPPAGAWTTTPPSIVDCDDGAVAIAGPLLWRPDCDGDGVASGAGLTGCVEPLSPCTGGAPAAGWVHDPGAPVDCDDSDSTTSELTDWAIDCDGDLWTQPDPVASCGIPASGCPGGAPFMALPFELSLYPDDCDDTRMDASVVGDWAIDCDGDGFFAEAAVAACGRPLIPCDGGAALGAVVPSGIDPLDDCDDAAAATFPGAPEVCDDNVDQDCSGADRPCPPPTITLTAEPLLTGAEAGDQAGSRLIVADLDGDGADDLIVGSPDMTDRSHSKIHVVYGPITPPLDLATVSTRIEGRAGLCVGLSMAVGDLDDDGDLDLAAQDWCYRPSTYDVGRVLTFVDLPAAPRSADDHATVIYPAADRRISFALAFGDLVGGPEDDLVLQSSRTASNTSTRGDVYVLQTPLPTTVFLPTSGAIHGPPADSQNVFGEAFTVDRTDPDGDGWDELYVTGVYLDPVSDGWIDRYGGVLRFPGPIDLTPGEALTKAQHAVYGWHRCARDGVDVRLADISGDGVPEVLTGSRYDLVGPASGGTPCDFTTGPGFAYPIERGFSGIAWSSDVAAGRHLVGQGGIGEVGGIGDFNGDGVDDFAVADTVSTGFGQFTTFYLFMGPWEGVLSLADARYEVEAGTYGFSGFEAGDVDGDGLSDLLLQTTRYPSTAESRGAVFVVYGR